MSRRRHSAKASTSSQQKTAWLKRPTTKPRHSVRPRDPALLRELARRVERQSRSRDWIRGVQSEIKTQLLQTSRTIDQPNFTRVSPEDLERLIRLYDARFFDGQLLLAVEAEGITFDFSSRMTSIAGKMVTHYPSGSRDAARQFELVLSSTLLFQTFEADVRRPVVVTGRPCHDRLEAMQRVAEHELVHLAEMLIWNDGNCNEPRFQSIARRYFDHTDYRHDLITQRERAARKFNVRVGDHVRFDFKGHVLKGRVNRITRRATILVPDPNGQRFSDGKHYLKYYIPLEHLRPDTN
ncbi:MAG: hypothetical protein AAGA03_04385 [Planctomycetota bacterium]